MKKSLIYSLIIITSLFSFLLFLSGFVFGINNIYSKAKSSLPSLPTKSVQPTDQWNIVGLGDSLTRGIGDKDGNGYIGMLQQDLTEPDYKAQLTNLAISGATSSDLLEQMNNRGVLRAISQSNLIVITIGGNDLFRGTDIQQINLDDVETTQKRYMNNTNKILTSIRNVNEEAPIYVIGLYNPFGDLEQKGFTSKIVATWNYQLETLTLNYDQVTFVPIADLFQGQLEAVLYSDHFHPNQEGYRRINNRLLQLIKPEQ